MIIVMLSFSKRSVRFSKCFPSILNHKAGVFTFLRFEARSGVAEWFRKLDLKSGGPWFKASTLPLSGFVLGSPEFNSSATASLHTAGVREI